MGDAYIQLRDEIRQLRLHCKAGKISKEDAAVEFKLLMGERKVLDKMVGIRMFGYPNGGKSFLTNLQKVQLYNEDETVKLLGCRIEDENIFCPIKKHEITRSDCLDYSGSTENFEECKDCDTGLANKRLLCPPQTKV